MTDDAAVESARADVEQAVQRFVAATAAAGGAFVTGWAVAFEYTSADLDENSQTADGVIVPGSQNRATSRGLFELGADQFRRT